MTGAELHLFAVMFVLYYLTLASYKSLSHKAINQGVGGLILIDTSNSPRYEYSNVLGISVKKSTTLGPVVKISAAMADSLLAKKNLSLSQVLTEANKKYCIPLGVEFKASTSFEPNEITAKNVVAVLEGSDPELINEYIVVGGHYDHVGFTEKISNKTGKMRTYIYNGADDNASGTTAVVELAKKFATQPQRPKRSIVFVAFDAEEEGLIGSAKFFNECLPFDTSQVKAMVNLDMVGRYNESKGVKIIGTDRKHRLQLRFENKHTYKIIILRLVGPCQLLQIRHTGIFLQHRHS